MLDQILGCVQFLWICCTLQSDGYQGNNNAQHVTFCKVRGNWEAPYMHLYNQLVLFFWTLKTVQCMKPSSPLNQTNSEHIVYLFCLKQETVSIQLELLEVPQTFLQWSVWVLPPLNSRFMENKQGKENLQKYPLTSNKENMQWLLYLQEPFILTIYFQMCTETPRFEKSLHLWTQKNKC